MRELFRTGRFTEIDLSFFALFTTVTALGLDLMDASQAARAGFSASKQQVARDWMSLALQALNLDNFFEHPQFDGLLSLFLISVYVVCQSDGNAVA